MTDPNVDNGLGYGILVNGTKNASLDIVAVRKLHSRALGLDYIDRVKAKDAAGLTYWLHRSEVINLLSLRPFNKKKRKARPHGARHSMAPCTAMCRRVEKKGVPSLDGTPFQINQIMWIKPVMRNQPARIGTHRPRPNLRRNYHVPLGWGPDFPIDRRLRCRLP